MTAFNVFKTKKPVAKHKTSVVEVKVAETNVVITPVSSILYPYVSEKATKLETMNQYMFKVVRTANKPEVKKAIQNRYKVTVVAVNMINMPSKKRTVGRHVGTKAGFRKAIVTLKEGDTINSAKA